MSQSSEPVREPEGPLDRANNLIELAASNASDCVGEGRPDEQRVVSLGPGEAHLWAALANVWAAAAWRTVHEATRMGFLGHDQFDELWEQAVGTTRHALQATRQAWAHWR